MSNTILEVCTIGKLVTVVNSNLKIEYPSPCLIELIFYRKVAVIISDYVTYRFAGQSKTPSDQALGYYPPSSLHFPSLHLFLVFVQRNIKGIRILSTPSNLHFTSLHLFLVFVKRNIKSEIFKKMFCRIFSRTSNGNGTMGLEHRGSYRFS